VGQGGCDQHMGAAPRASVRAAGGARVGPGQGCASCALCSDPVRQAGAPPEAVADANPRQGVGEGDKEGPDETALHG